MTFELRKLAIAGSAAAAALFLSAGALAAPADEAAVAEADQIIDSTGVETPATAEEAKVAAAEPAAGEDPNEMICKTKETTGSRLRKSKVCKTRAQWESTFNSFRGMNNLKDSYSTNPPSN